MRGIILFLAFLRLSYSYAVNLPLSDWRYEALDRMLLMERNGRTITTLKPITLREMRKIAKEESMGGRIFRLHSIDLHLIGSSGNPGFENEGGEKLYGGVNKWVELFISGEISPFLSFSIKPYLKLDRDGAKFRLLESYVKLTLFNLELEVGRDSLWLGPGYHGALLLSNNASPFDLVKLSNPLPFRFPWIFRKIGDTKFAFFLTQLNEGREEGPYLAGMRVVFLPFSWLEIGGSRIVMRSEKKEREMPLRFEDYLKILIGKAEHENGDYTHPRLDNDQYASLDFKLSLPIRDFLPIDFLQLYMEYAGEDKINRFWEIGGLKLGPIPSIAAIARLFGIYAGAGKTSLRVEYAQTLDDKFRWYHHHTLDKKNEYGECYIFKGFLIGHHMGGDAKDFFVELTRWISPVLFVKVGFDFEERRKIVSGSPYIEESGGNYEREKKYEGWIGLEYKLSKKFKVRAKYEYEMVKNRLFKSGIHKRGQFFQLSFWIGF